MPDFKQFWFHARWKIHKALPTISYVFGALALFLVLCTFVSPFVVEDRPPLFLFFAWIPVVLFGVACYFVHDTGWLKPNQYMIYDSKVQFINCTSITDDIDLNEVYYFEWKDMTI